MLSWAPTHAFSLGGPAMPWHHHPGFLTPPLPLQSPSPPYALYRPPAPRQGPPGHARLAVPRALIPFLLSTLPFFLGPLVRAALPAGQKPLGPAFPLSLSLSGPGLISSASILPALGPLTYGPRAAYLLASTVLLLQQSGISSVDIWPSPPCPPGRPFLHSLPSPFSPCPRTSVRLPPVLWPSAGTLPPVAAWEAHTSSTLNLMPLLQILLMPGQGRRRRPIFHTVPSSRWVLPSLV